MNETTPSRLNAEQTIPIDDERMKHHLDRVARGKVEAAAYPPPLSPEKAPSIGRFRR
jgi:hypothetical protein